jgi:protein-tyrosine phosphatase
MEGIEPVIIRDDEQLDYSWVTEQFALGGAIWNRANMRQLAKAGITHIVDLQTTFDDTPIAEGTGISVLWSPFRDDLQAKEPELFERVVDFSLAACRLPESRIYIHCEEGIHRSPMMLLAVLGALGMKLTEAEGLIRRARPQADFPAAYRQSIVRFVAAYRERMG